MTDAMQSLRDDTSMGRHRRTGLDIPTSWTPAHLAVRFRDHFDYWKRTPDFRGPKQFGAAWPAFSRSWQDIAGYNNKDGEPDDVRRIGDPYAEHMNAINRVVVPLNGYEVLIRDAMQDYLIGFRQADEASCTLIVFDGQMTVDGWGLRDRAQKWGMPKSTYDEARKRALNACCIFLNGRGKAVL